MSADKIPISTEARAKVRSNARPIPADRRGDRERRLQAGQSRLRPQEGQGPAEGEAAGKSYSDYSAWTQPSSAGRR